MTSKCALDKMREIIGDELFAKVSKELHGATVYFGEYNGFSNKKDRNQKIREDYYSATYDVPQLAQKYELSISTIYKIVQKY